MKIKFLSVLAIAAIFASCKSNMNEPTNVSFEEGEEITIAIGRPGNDAQSARKVTGWVRGGDEGPEELGTIDFQWEKGDYIKIVANGQSSIFRMLDNAEYPSDYGDDEYHPFLKEGGGVAYFRGHMPADCETFDIVYGPDEVPTWQEFHWDGIANNTMRFEKKNCTLSDLEGVIELKPQWCVLRTKYVVDFSYPTGENYSTDPNFTAHNRVGQLKVTAIKSDNSQFVCTYNIPKEYAYGAASGAYGVYDCVNIVLPPATYKEIDFMSISSEECIGILNEDKEDEKIVMIGTLNNPNKVTKLLLADPGLTLLGGEYTNVEGGITASYTYQLVPEVEADKLNGNITPAPIEEKLN